MTADSDTCEKRIQSEAIEKRPIHGCELNFPNKILVRLDRLWKKWYLRWKSFLYRRTWKKASGKNDLDVISDNGPPKMTVATNTAANCRMKNMTAAMIAEVTDEEARFMSVLRICSISIPLFRSFIKALFALINSNPFARQAVAKKPPASPGFGILNPKNPSIKGRACQRSCKSRPFSVVKSGPHSFILLLSFIAFLASLDLSR